MKILFFLPVIITLSVMITSPAVCLAEGKISTEENTEDTHSILGSILLYIPNRAFDLLDIVRLRLKVGPGMGVGIHPTKYGEIYLGSHAAIWAGLPGPRQSACFPVPAGVETRAGISLSVLDATIDTVFGPDYSPSEIGGNIYLGFLGLDLTIDPVEILDFLGGFILLDIRGDDF